MGTDNTNPPKPKPKSSLLSVLVVKFDEGIECSQFVHVRCAPFVVQFLQRFLTTNYINHHGFFREEMI